MTGIMVAAVVEVMVGNVVENMVIAINTMLGVKNEFNKNKQQNLYLM